MADYPIPGAGVYGSAVEMAKTRYQQRLADLNKQRQGQLRNSGFTADINDQGLLSNLRTDPSNPYGAYQLLNRAQAQRFGTVEEENIGRRLGSGGGLAAQRMNDARFQAGQEDAQFGQMLQDQLAALDRMQQDYRYEYDQTMWQAQQAAAQQAIEAGDYYPADLPADPYGPYPVDPGVIYADPNGALSRVVIAPAPAPKAPAKTVTKRPAVLTKNTKNRLAAGRM